LVLFPAADRAEMWPWCWRPGDLRSVVSRGAQVVLHNRIWKDRFASYHAKGAISSFTRQWTNRWWQIDCDIIYPPVEGIAQTKKSFEPLIASVGRINPLKRHLDLIRAFTSMVDAGLSDWSLCCAGGLSNKSSDVEYLRQMEQSGAIASVDVVANPSRERLMHILSKASVYWHAMGYGEDEDPLRMEHFGISTVEAMAAGCVPVVIKRGGQPEIVRHGVDGFLWETIEELQGFTTLLVRDIELRSSMADSARRRAQLFNKQRFVHEVASRCGLAISTEDGRN
jgi:glycosyltransferase involved in cell wall biosynthesis